MISPVSGKGRKERSVSTLPAPNDSPKHFLARVARRFRRRSDWRALRDEALSLRDETVDALGQIQDALGAEKAA
jgi:hypothetical protein